MVRFILQMRTKMVLGDPNERGLDVLWKSGYVENSDDCNDNNEAIYPEAQEFARAR